jgi:hypothetical protein
MLILASQLGVPSLELGVFEALASCKVAWAAAAIMVIMIQSRYADWHWNSLTDPA